MQRHRLVEAAEVDVDPPAALPLDARRERRVPLDVSVRVAVARLHDVQNLVRLL